MSPVGADDDGARTVSAGLSDGSVDADFVFDVTFGVRVATVALVGAVAVLVLAAEDGAAHVLSLRGVGGGEVFAHVVARHDGVFFGHEHGKKLDDLRLQGGGW